MLRSSSLRFAVLAAAFLTSSGLLAQGTPNLPERLLINEFLVEGNTVLPVGLIEQTVAPFLGPDRKLDDVYAAQDALAKAYEAAGYVSASVRALRLDPVEYEWGKGWTAVLVVTEGRVERLRISGAQFTAPSEVRERVTAVAEGQVPHFPTLQKQLGEVAGMADLSVTPLLRPGRDPGTMEVELKVEDKLPLHAWAQLSNEQSPDTSPRRMELGLRYDNLWQAQHSASLRFINTPLRRDEIKVGAFSYSLPTGAADERLTLYAVRSDSQVNTDTGTGVVGKGTTLGLRQTVAIDSKPGAFERLNYGLDFKRLDETTQQDGSNAGSKPVQYMPFAFQYIGMFQDDGGRWNLSSGLTAGFGLMDRKVGDCGGFGEREQFDCRRAGASSSFLVWSAELRREQKLGKWQGKARAGLHLASGPLLSSEQFFLGGADSARGYYQSEVGGDDGAGFSLELLTPSLMPKDSSVGLRLLGFLDGGWVHTQEALAGQEKVRRLASTGMGLRVSWSRFLSGSLDWGYTLTRGARTKKGSSRVHGLVRAEF